LWRFPRQAQDEKKPTPLLRRRFHWHDACTG
jgi:hypothetical protein